MVTSMYKPNYYISKDHEFVIENYNAAPCFSSFFPGIAGIFGCPMWVFYTNRGQCIASAGVQDKDGAIMEFQPANKAYRSVSLSGFRTFLKVDGIFYEPFFEQSPFKNEMRIFPHSLKLVEENPKLKIQVEATFFTVPHEFFPALARTLTIKNLSKKKRNIEVIDGLPVLIPYGFSDSSLKKISQTISAWCVVENLGKKAPFYKLKILPQDIAETNFIEKGNFFVSFSDLGQNRLIVDPKIVFGNNAGLEAPDNFIKRSAFNVPADQLTEGFIPSALAFKKFKLEKNKDFSLFSLLGQADNLALLDKIKKKAAKKSYFAQKFKENRFIIEDICSVSSINSSSRSFNLYSRQNFLDNAMRGGLPLNIDDKVIYLYYRKHGDLERDYNDFKLMPSYFSQGNGNYRDINQNRRNDIFINPDIVEDNIVRFFNLIQLDGYNPLIVLGSKFFVDSKNTAENLLKKHIKNPGQDLLETVTRPFILGNLLKNMEENSIEFKTQRDSFAEDLVDLSIAEEGALHGEGFWIDHFSYNTDLLESFECVYPDKTKEILFNKLEFTFFDNDHLVAKRGEKYCLIGGKIRQFQSVQQDSEKQALILNRGPHNHVVRTNFGRGQKYYTTLAAKALCLIANKAASFDAEGIGIEMEADKPDWYDALNGLPGLLGSSLSVTLELKRLCSYFLSHFPSPLTIILPVEVKNLIESINSQLADFFKHADHFKYWDKTYKIKEDYRDKTRLGIKGEEAGLSGKAAAEFLNNVIKKCDLGIKKCLDQYNNYYTYFINEVSDFEQVNGGIKAKKFKQIPLPLFLEGFVHALKVEKDKNIYQAVKNSRLYDQKLKMYKVNAPLDCAPIEIGRCKIFTPGWLENESIWVHMEYKYMLELLKAGMYKEFFADFKNIFIPFMDPKKYKRSILENSSFLVSSAHPDKENHGRGFVARLSGATAEFIDIWLHLTSGKKIFYLDEKGKLCFKLSPILPAWLFNKGKLSFTLLGSIEVTYINKKAKDTFDSGVSPASYKLIFEDKEIEVGKPFVPEPYSNLIRDRKIKKIIATLL